MKKPLALILCSAILLITGAAAINAQEILNIGTNPTGSSYHIIGAAITTIVEKYTPIKMKVIPMDAAHAWMPLMVTGQIDLGVASNWNAEKGYFGQAFYKDLSKGKGFPIELMYVSVPNVIGLIVAGSSDIGKISDLKGKRVAGPIPNEAMQLQTESLLANGGLKWSDIKPVPVKSITDGVKAVIEGRADAASIAVGTPIVEELQAKKGARFLPLDPSPDAEKRTKSVFPGYAFKVSPGPAKTGIEKEQYLWAYDNYIVVRKNLAEDVVYQVTKALWDHCSELASFHAGLKDLKTSMFVSKEALIPYHPGAIKLYKEKGVWTKEMEALQKKLLEAKQS
jgi:TRAP transporter TAXI family solute receptor